MHVAFIGHAHHLKTGSSRFFLEILQAHATVETRYAEPGPDAALSLGTDFDETRYDAIVVWQLHEAFDLLSGRHPNVTFVPMYDAMFWGGGFYWTTAFNAAKTLCFSWALRREVMRLGAVQAGFQYFPDPSRQAPVTDFDTLRGLLWYRRRDITPTTLFRLTQGTEFSQVILHDAPDPGHADAGGWTVPRHIARLDRTGWSAGGEAYAAALAATNVFFAPRPLEGIGMSVLEAMASGHCVVAPQAATMDEYISHGTNGLLYVPGRRTRLDFTAARDLGARARESVARGHERWQASIPALIEFLATPTQVLRRQGAAHRVLPLANPAAPTPRPGRDGRPLVSVVTVCRNAAAELEATMASVLAQTGCDFEYVVLDGLSTDGSVGIIERHAARLGAWRSTADSGPYDAMNRSLELARGEYLLFMNAGDAFAGEDALHRMFAQAPVDADVVYGHHIYRRQDGAEELHRAAEFETTWSRLQSGEMWFDWLSGIPGHQSTAVRRELLAELRFDTRYRIAADHDLLFRARAAGARFFNCDEVIALYVAGGLSAQQYARCRQEWAELARTQGNLPAVDAFYAHLEAVSEPVAPAATLFRRPDRRALRGFAIRLIGAADRRSPLLARAARKVLRRPALMRVIRRLLGIPSPNQAAPADTATLEAFEAGIDFRQPELPDWVQSVEGLAPVGEMGTATTGAQVTLRLHDPLPPRFDLDLAAHAEGKAAAVSLATGPTATPIRILVGTTPGRRYLVPLGNPGGTAREIVITLDSQARLVLAGLRILARDGG